MKLKAFTLSGITLACLATSNIAIADDEWVDVYGKISISLDKIDEDNGDDQWELNSNASRFGVKGKGDASEGLEAFYQIEWEVDMTDKSKSSADHLKARNQIVGLRGSFGEVFAGRHDTPTKTLQKKVDLFGDLTGDIKHTFNGEFRADNIVQYTTPNMGGFNAKVAFIPGEETDVNDGLADGTSIALEFKTGDLEIGASFDADVEDEGIDTTRLMAQYKMDAWQFGLLYQDTDNNGVDASGLMASAQFNTGNNTFKLQLTDSDIYSVSDTDKIKYGSQTSIGWDHKLGKKTSVFTYLTLSEDGTNNDKDSIFGLGIVQKF